MTFRPFVKPSAFNPNPWAITIGLSAGSALGSLLAAPAWLVSAPSPGIALLTTAATALVGAGVASFVDMHRRAYAEVALKASSLLEETWEAQGEQRDLEVRIDTHLLRSRRDEEVLSSHVELLGSIGDATQDTVHRMTVNLEGLAMTSLTPAQQRLVSALLTHTRSLSGLAEDIAHYADLATGAPTPTPQTSGHEIRAIAA
jgi:hypothetical protein